MTQEENQMEAVRIASEEIRLLNSRIAAGYEVIEMCKEQMAILKKRRAFVLELKRACEQGNISKLESLRYSVAD